MQKKSISMLNLGICESVYVENSQRSVESLLFSIYLHIFRDLYRCCIWIVLCINTHTRSFSSVGKLNLYLKCKNSFMCICRKGTYVNNEETDNFNHFNFCDLVCSEVKSKLNDTNVYLSRENCVIIDDYWEKKIINEIDKIK